MKATRFEYRHQVLLHLLLVGLALLTYVISPDDIVWALVRHHSNSAFLERLSFGAGTLTNPVEVSHDSVRKAASVPLANRPAFRRESGH